MKYFAIIIIAASFFSCEEAWDFNDIYTIKQGEHASSINVEMLQNDRLGFYTTFNSSAIYTSSTTRHPHSLMALIHFPFSVP